MSRFLVDANLPLYFSAWHSSDYVHVLNLDDSWSDEQIWKYAKENELIILTKDADFKQIALIKGVPPKIIHFKTGNLRIAQFHALVSKLWPQLLIDIQDHSIITVFNNRIELVK
jgi:predicted nuclease of predicted toxin-antitoxin system